MSGRGGRAAARLLALAVLASLVVPPASAQPYIDAPPPDGEDCRGLLAAGIASSRLWQGYYAGTRRGDSERSEVGASRGHCFPSHAACAAWLYDMRTQYSLRTFRDECRRFAG